MQTSDVKQVTALPPDRLLRFPQVHAKTNVGRTKTYELVNAGEFPAPIKVGAASFWVEREIDAWIEQKIAARDAARINQAVSS